MRCIWTGKRLGVAPGVLFLLLAVLTSPANTITWDGSSGANWNLGANWVGDMAPGPGDEAVFSDSGIVADMTIQLGASQTVNCLTINASKMFSIGTAGDVTASNTLTLVNLNHQNTQSNTINVDVILASNSQWTVSGSGILYVNGAVQGSTNRLTKLGSGELKLCGNSDYTGVTTVLEGEITRVTGSGNLKGNLVVGSVSNGPSASYTCAWASGVPDGKSITVYTNGSYYQGDWPGCGDVIIIGGTVNTSWPNIDGAIRMTGGTLSGGPIQGTHGAHFTYACEQTALISGDFRIANNLWYDAYFTVQDGPAPIDLKISAQIINETANYSVKKDGAGVMQLTSASSTFNSQFFKINAGTVLMDNSSGACAGKAATEVAGGATLGGTGFVGGVLYYTNAGVRVSGSIANRGAIAPGTINSTDGTYIPGTLTVGSVSWSNDVVIGNYGSLKINFLPDGGHGQLKVFGQLDLSATNDVLEFVLPQERVQAGTYTLVTVETAFTNAFNTIVNMPHGALLTYETTTLKLLIPPIGTLIKVL